jgi:hypothetical protein
MRCERTKKKERASVAGWRPHMACGHRQNPQKAGIAALYLVSNMHDWPTTRHDRKAKAVLSPRRVVQVLFFLT